MERAPQGAESAGESTANLLVPAGRGGRGDLGPVRSFSEGLRPLLKGGHCDRDSIDRLPVRTPKMTGLTPGCESRRGSICLGATGQ